MPPGVAGASSATTDRALACGNCHAPMRRVSLGGHYGTNVDLDICESCDLVWFDGAETARLSGSGMLDLIGDMARGYDLPFEPLRPGATCPRCRGRLALVHNQSRWGRSVQLQCVARDGAYQSAVAAVQALAPALRAATSHPPAEVVKRRLAAIDADAPRQREWAADMARDARREAASTSHDRDDWSSYFVGGVTPARVIYVALAIWFAWDLWHRR